MTLLILGLVLFLGTHLVPAVPGVRRLLSARLTENRYKAAFSLASLAGLVLIVVGFAWADAASREYLFAPWPAARKAAPGAMVVAFILFAAANMRGYLRKVLQHPMLIGVIVWSGVHLLANGEVRTTVLFGAVLAYAAVDLVSAVSRHAVKAFEPQAKYDAMAVVGGIVVALLFATFHRVLFGVAVAPWGV